MRINKKIIYNYKKPSIIAEISGNHASNKKRFLKLIKGAFSCGADLVKIQTYEPIDITLKKKDKNFKINSGPWKNMYLWDLYKKASTPFSWHKEAFDIAKKFNKKIFSSPFSLRAVDLLEKFKCPIYKIASFEITDFKLIKYIASKNKKIFPNNEIGLSDHTNGIATSIIATNFGISYIEKHFNLDEMETPDASFSINPDQLRELSSAINYIFGKDKNTSYIRRKNLFLRRSIYSKKNIKENEKISDKNIDTLRPTIGICASKYFEILNRRVKRNIKKNEPIFYSDLK